MSKIENEKKQVPTSRDMNDMDILNDTLQCLKELSNYYNLASGEMGSKKLYKQMMSLHKETKELAREAFDIGFRYGWYPLEAAEDKKITQLHDEAKKQIKELA